MSWFGTASKRKKWLVGVSGGADSVALLHMLVAGGFKNLVVCHLNHRLRGRASSGDAKFVERLASGMSFPVEIASADVNVLAADRRESIETAARHARHQFFSECAVRHRCSRVILAHHADDQAETILWNLLRGSHGLKGMKALQEIQGIEFHRPLLEWRKKDLCLWLSERRIKWREDASNQEPFAVRNRLRNEVFPLLDEVSARDSAASFNRLALDFSEVSEVLDFSLKHANIFDPQGRIHIPAFKALPMALRKESLARYLRTHGITPTRALIISCLHMMEGGSASSVNLPGGGWLRRRAGRAFVDFQNG